MLRRLFKIFNYSISKRVSDKHQLANEYIFLLSFRLRPGQNRIFSNFHLNSKRMFTTSQAVNYFGNSFLDRQSDKRKDNEWIAEQMKSPKSVFVLFHVDKPFVDLNKEKNTFGLSKFNYDQVKKLLETSDNQKCNWLFLGIEYERNGNSDDNEKKENLNDNDVNAIRSPYSDVENYNRDEFKSWFAVDTSGFDENVDNVGKIFGGSGKFFEGNFLRLMAIQNVFESSVIAQVTLQSNYLFLFICNI